MNRLAETLERPFPCHAVSVGRSLTPQQFDDVANYADVLEFRADLFDHHEHQYLREQIESFGTMPLLLTVRHPNEGGHPVPDRFAVYEALIEHVDGVDIELASPLAPDVVKLAKALGKVVILSNHDFEKTPDSHVLASRLASAEIQGADYFKIAALANNLSDYQQLCDFTMENAQNNVIAVAMGQQYGPLSRVTLPFVGSKLTYSYPQFWSAVAPGQVGHRTLSSLLNQVATLSTIED